MMPCHSKCRKWVFHLKRQLCSRRGVIDLCRMLRITLPPLSVCAVLADIMQKSRSPCMFFRAEFSGKTARKRSHLFFVFPK